ncbi:uncharacterized protein TNCV_1023021 [Trichonephila clavipes]|nr:uncharacterized protein TNCV_1023021 [Trichonephila clavipes]
MLDVTKYPPSAHGFTCGNCGGGDRGRVAIYRPFGEVSLSLNRTVTCMVLKANDRRTSCPCHDEFRGPRSDYVRQELENISLQFTCRNCGGGDRGRVAIYRPFGVVSLSLNRTVTCMVLKANDRRTSDTYVRQVALATTTTIILLASAKVNPNIDETCGATSNEGQGLLCPTQYMRHWALRGTSRGSSQEVSLTRKPPVLSSAANFVLILSHEKLSQPCPARGLNLRPVLWKRDALTTQPLGFLNFRILINI